MEDPGASMHMLSRKDPGASMHMLSRKDLHSAELETGQVSRSPKTFITANGEVQTNAEATVYVYDLDFFGDSTNPRGYATSPTAWKAFAKITDIRMSGLVVKSHSSVKMTE